MKLSLLSLVLVLAVAQPISAANFATKVTDATFKLFHPESTSTCFLLYGDEPDAAFYLVTTAHTLERSKGETVTLVLRKPKKNGDYERLDYKVQIRIDEKPLGVRHKTQDVAVLRLSRPLPVPVAALPVTWLANNLQLKAAGVHICSRLFVLTYPEHRIRSRSLPQQTCNEHADRRMASRGTGKRAGHMMASNQPIFLTSERGNRCDFDVLWRGFKSTIDCRDAA